MSILGLLNESFIVLFIIKKFSFFENVPKLSSIPLSYYVCRFGLVGLVTRPGQAHVSNVMPRHNRIIIIKQSTSFEFINVI